MTGTTQKLSIEITTDLKRSVESFQRLQKSLADSQAAFAEARAKAGQLKAEFEAAGGQVDHLGIQIALAKRALADLSANGIAKTHVEYQALEGEIATMEAELRRQLPPLKALEKEYQAAERSAQRWQRQIDQQSEALGRQGQALEKEGLDVANLTRHYEQLAAAGEAAARARASVAKVREAWKDFTTREDQRQALREQSTRQYAALAAATDEGRSVALADSARAVLGLRGAADIRAEIAKIRKAYADLANSGRATAAELAQAHERMVQRVRTLSAQLPMTGMPVDKLGTNASRARAELDRMGQQGSAALARIERQSTAATAGTDRLATAVKRAGHYFAAWQIGSAALGAGRELIVTAAAWDRVDASLAITEGDARKALETLSWLKKLSNELGLELRPTADAFAKLNASAKGAVMEGEPVRRVFASLVGAMSRMGAESRKISLALDAVGQMISKVVVNADDLRQQLGDHLYGAMQHVARGMGMTVVQLNEMMTSGRLLADDMLPKLAAELDRALGTGRITTLQANLNRLSTAWDLLKKNLADGSGLKTGIGMLVEGIDGATDRLLRFRAVRESLLNNSRFTGPEWTAENLQATLDALSRGPAYQQGLRPVIERRLAELNPPAPPMVGPPKPPALSDSDALFLESLKTSDQKAVEAVQAKIHQLKALRDKIVATLGEAKYQALEADLDQQLAKALKKAEDKLGQGETKFDALFAAAEQRYGLQKGLLKAVADVESGFNPKARNPSGAQGLMQLMPDTARRYGVADRYDPAQSIEGAAKYIAKLFEEMGGDVVKVIAAYNSLSAYKAARAGQFDIAKLPNETQDYIEKVSGKLGKYGNLQVDVRTMEAQAQRRQKLAEETARFEAQRRQAQLEAAKRADEQETARLSAAFQAREITARQYYDRLDQIQIAAARREALELVKQLRAEETRQTARAQGTEEYLKGQERIFALEQQIAAVRDRADLAAQANRQALASATREQSLALSDQLNQIKLRLLELRAEPGPKLADIVIPPEQQELFRQRLQVLQDQYRDFLAQLRQAGDTEGLAKVNELITAEALRDLQGKMDQATEFGIQAARNIQSGFANFLFDPFDGGLKGMARGFAETLRRMTAEAASAMLMKGLLGEHFEKGEIGGWLGGLLKGARSAGPATPYPKGSVPESAQVGPPAPSTTVATMAPTADQHEFDAALKQFETGFTQIFDGDFFSGLGTIFEGGFGGIVSALGSLIAGFFGGGSGSGGGGALRDAQTAIGLVGSIAGAFAGGVGNMVGAGVSAAGNGINAVNVSSAGASWGGMFQSGQYHKGGLVGLAGERRTLPAIAFAGAPRYHGGGIAGLKPNEVPAVLMGGPKGQREEILTADDPRHRDNLDRAPRGKPQAAGGAASDTTVNVVNVLDPSLVGQYMSTKAGERLVMNILSRNSGAVQKIAGGSRG